MKTEWTVQHGYEFHNQEVELLLSNQGEWAFAYGTQVKGIHVIETIITGFRTEQEAMEAANDHCYQAAEEKAIEASI